MNTTRLHETAEPLSDALWDLWKIWHHRSQIAHGAQSVTAEQYWLLRQMGLSGTTTVTELARTRGVTKAAITIATRKMESLGWVNRRRESDNQRVVRLSLTDRGRALWQEIRRERQSILRDMVQQLSETEQQDLLRLVAKIKEMSWDQDLEWGLE